MVHLVAGHFQDHGWYARSLEHELRARPLACAHGRAHGDGARARCPHLDVRLAAFVVCVQVRRVATSSRRLRIPGETPGRVARGGIVPKAARVVPQVAVLTSRGCRGPHPLGFWRALGSRRACVPSGRHPPGSAGVCGWPVVCSCGGAGALGCSCLLGRETKCVRPLGRWDGQGFGWLDDGTRRQRLRRVCRCACNLGARLGSVSRVR